MESKPPEEYKAASLEEIKDTIKNSPNYDETVHRFICDEVGFWRLQALLEEHRVAGLYFDASLKHLRFVTMPTWIHNNAASWFTIWAQSLAQYPQLSNSQPSVGQIDGLHGRNKEPDAGFCPEDNPGLPTIVVEVGYSETLPELQFDARVLLEGSQGQIQLVILIHIQQLQRGDTSIQKAVIQLWEYDSKRNKAVYKTQLNVIPPPKNHSKQQINIPWTTILRAGPFPTTPLPPLKLDGLRSKIEFGLKQHLLMKERAMKDPILSA